MALNLKEVKALIVSYESELNKLQYQIANIDSILEKLKKNERKLEKKAAKNQLKSAKNIEACEALNESESSHKNSIEEVFSKAKKGPGRPRKNKDSNDLRMVGSGKKVVRIVQGIGGEIIKNNVRSTLIYTGEKGPRLSEWDHFLIDKLKEADELLTRPEINELFAQKADDVGGMTEDDTLKKGSNTLHKLATKYNTVIKYPFPGRGYVYGIPEWFFANSGDLKKSYRVKLLKKAKRLGKL